MQYFKMKKSLLFDRKEIEGQNITYNHVLRKTLQ